MPSLNVISLLAGTAVQAQGGNTTVNGAALQDSAVVDFAPVLNEQVQQLQGQAGAKTAISAPVPGLVAAFLQRLSITVADNSGQAATGGNGDLEGDGAKIQALIGRILELLQQQGPGAAGQDLLNQGQDGKDLQVFSVQSLAQLKLVQIETLSKILGVSIEEVKLALAALMKEQVEGAAITAVPAQDNDDFDDALRTEEERARAKDMRADAVIEDGAYAVLVQSQGAAVVIPEVAVEEGTLVDEAELQEILIGTTDVPGALLASAATPVAGDGGSGSSLPQPDRSADTVQADDTAAPEGEVVVAQDWFGTPVAIAAATPVTDAAEAVPVIALPAITVPAGVVQGSRAKATAKAETPVVQTEASVSPAAAGETVSVGTVGVTTAAKDKIVHLAGHAAKKEASERAKQAMDKAEARAASADDAAQAEIKAAPGVVTEEIPEMEKFSDTESGTRKITGVTPDYSGIRDMSAVSGRKVVEHLGVPHRNVPPPPVPVAEQVLVKIRDAANHEGKQIQIQLDPKDLGKVDVRLDVGTDGRTQVTMTVDKRETLDMLQRDRVSLEKALGDLGMKTDSGGMNFNLREQPRGQQQLADQNAQGGGQGWRGEPLPEELREELQPTQPYRSGYLLSIDEGVNISV